MAIHRTVRADHGCWLHPSSSIGRDCRFGRYAHAQKGSEIGERTSFGEWSEVEEGARIGPDCRIGPKCIIHALANIGAGTEIGEGVRIPPGCRVAPGTKIPSFHSFDFTPGEISGGRDGKPLRATPLEHRGFVEGKLAGTLLPESVPAAIDRAWDDVKHEDVWADDPYMHPADPANGRILGELGRFLDAEGLPVGRVEIQVPVRPDGRPLDIVVKTPSGDRRTLGGDSLEMLQRALDAPELWQGCTREFDELALVPGKRLAVRACPDLEKALDMAVAAATEPEHGFQWEPNDWRPRPAQAKAGRQSPSR